MHQRLPFHPLPQSVKKCYAHTKQGQICDCLHMNRMEINTPTLGNKPRSVRWNQRSL